MEERQSDLSSEIKKLSVLSQEGVNEIKKNVSERKNILFLKNLWKKNLILLKHLTTEMKKWNWILERNSYLTPIKTRNWFDSLLKPDCNATIN